MRKLIWLIICLSVFVFSLPAFAQDFEGVRNGAAYKIRVPDSWNGVLLMYSHGYAYTERYDVNQFNFSFADAAPGGEPMESFLLNKGYALAGTAFSSKGGWQIKEAIRTLNSLLGFFRGKVGNPDKVILIGYSMGSLIGINAAEKKSFYDGVIAGCTLGAGTTGTFSDLTGAYSLAYDVLFGWPASWGTWYDVRDDLSFQNEVLPVLISQLQDPNNFGKFEFLRLIADATSEGFYVNDPDMNLSFLFLIQFFVTEGRAEIEVRAKGPIVENITHYYSLPPEDIGYLSELGVDANQVLDQMNASTNITTKFPQKKYMDKYFDPSGDLNVPLISIHESKDGLAPPYHETLLLETIQNAGEDNMFLQVFTGDVGHCTFTQEQVLETVNAMEYWIDQGVKPTTGFFPADLGFLQNDYIPPPFPIGTK